MASPAACSSRAAASGAAHPHPANSDCAAPPPTVATSLFVSRLWRDGKKASCASNLSTPARADERARRRRSSPFSRWSASMNGLDAKKLAAANGGGGDTKFYVGDDDFNVKRVLEAVASDQMICTNPYQKRKRRTVMLNRSMDQKFGFTIQTYTFGRRNGDARSLCGSQSLPSETDSAGGTCVVEQVTYVDYVEFDSPAGLAGLRPGDVIVAINGVPVTGRSHEQLVGDIAKCHRMRMVVLFENCVEKVELCSRAIQLKRLLVDKRHELLALEAEEQSILSGRSVADDTIDEESPTAAEATSHDPHGVVITRL